MCNFTLHKKECQHVPTGADEVICTRCYCDRARLAVICVSPFYFPSQKECQQNLLHLSPSTHNRVLVGTGTCNARAKRRVEKEAIRHLQQGHTIVGL
jgi:hypothetical protein